MNRKLFFFQTVLCLLTHSNEFSIPFYIVWSLHCHISFNAFYVLHSFIVVMYFYWVEEAKKIAHIYVTSLDISMCEIYIGNLKTRNSRNWFRYETFIHLFEFKGFSTWGERDTIFLCWLLLHSQLSTQQTRGKKSFGLAQLWKSTFFRGKNSTHCFSQIPKSSAHAFGHDVIHLPSPISYQGILFWHLWMTHPPRVRVNTCINVALN